MFLDRGTQALIDILFVSKNRLAYTRESFHALVANTDWDQVSGLFLADDDSTDGTLAFLTEAADEFETNYGVPVELRKGRIGGPVAATNWAVSSRSVDADRMAKIDNDVIVCPGWLTEMLRMLTIFPMLDILGMQPRFGPPIAAPDCPHRTIEPCRHIGGVGIMRHRAFELCQPVANGRWGFTEWQTQHPVIEKAWITPDLPCFCLDLIDLEPWASLAKTYVAKGWARAWPIYEMDGGRSYYGWWTPVAP